MTGGAQQSSAPFYYQTHYKPMPMDGKRWGDQPYHVLYWPHLQGMCALTVIASVRCYDLPPFSPCENQPLGFGAVMLFVLEDKDFSDWFDRSMFGIGEATAIYSELPTKFIWHTISGADLDPSKKYTVAVMAYDNPSKIQDLAVVGHSKNSRGECVAPTAPPSPPPMPPSPPPPNPPPPGMGSEVGAALNFTELMPNMRAAKEFTMDARVAFKAQMAAAVAKAGGRSPIGVVFSGWAAAPGGVSITAKASFLSGDSAEVLGALFNALKDGKVFSGPQLGGAALTAASTTALLAFPPPPPSPPSPPPPPKMGSVAGYQLSFVALLPGKRTAQLTPALKQQLGSSLQGFAAAKGAKNEVGVAISRIVDVALPKVDLKGAAVTFSLSVHPNDMAAGNAIRQMLVAKPPNQARAG
eukprot:scaffold12.g7983.t1